MGWDQNRKTHIDEWGRTEQSEVCQTQLGTGSCTKKPKAYSRGKTVYSLYGARKIGY